MSGEKLQTTFSVANGDISAGSARDAETLLGFEGAAAAQYFQAFPEMIKTVEQDRVERVFDFMARNRRPPTDPVNALLSLAYSLLARTLTVTLSSIGFDPYLGFYHRPRFDRPALALDLMEPFRPLLADSAVLTALNNGEVKPGDFTVRANGVALTPEGRKRFIGVFERRLSQEVTHPRFGYRISYRRLLELEGRLLARHLLGELPDYTGFVTR